MQIKDGRPGLSEVWSRLEECRFRLSDCVAVHPVTYRGVDYYLLNNRLDGQQFRISATVYRLIGKMNGRRTLAQICSQHTADDSDTESYRKKILESVTRLHTAGFLISNLSVNHEVIVSHRRSIRQMRKNVRWAKWLAPRIPLFDPDRILARLVPRISHLFDVRLFYSLLMLVVVSALLGIINVESLIVFGAKRIGDPSQWMLLIVVFPLIKALHEAGHCVAAKYSGISIHEVGVTFLVFMPVPYVNASSASTIQSRKLRILISAAGILVEVLLASVALLIWLTVQDGIIREISYAVILVAGISTVLFNGNPLLRFDGYYILMDVIEMPNLASRSATFYRQLIRRKIFGLAADKTTVYQISECRWMLFYGAASTLYRIGIGVAMALFFYLNIPVLGVVLAIWILMAQLLVPFLGYARSLVSPGELPECSLKRAGVLFFCFSMLFLATSLPVYTQVSVVEGIVMLPQRAIVRAETDGFLQHIYQEDNTKVKRGDIVLELVHPELDNRIQLMRARIKELELRYETEPFSDHTARRMQEVRLKEARERLHTLLDEKARHLVRSTAAGFVRLSVDKDAIGRFIRQGDSLAYLSDEKSTVVRIVTTQRDAVKLRGSVEDIEVRLISDFNKTFTGTLLGEVPLGSDTLPSAALGSRSGGAIRVDARDVTGVTSLNSVFTFDVEIPAPEGGEFVGSRALVRFNHGSSALLTELYRFVRYAVFAKTGI